VPVCLRLSPETPTGSRGHDAVCVRAMGARFVTQACRYGVYLESQRCHKLRRLLERQPAVHAFAPAQAVAAEPARTQMLLRGRHAEGSRRALLCRAIGCTQTAWWHQWHRLRTLSADMPRRCVLGHSMQRSCVAATAAHRGPATPQEKGRTAQEDHVDFGRWRRCCQQWRWCDRRRQRGWAGCSGPGLHRGAAGGGGGGGGGRGWGLGPAG
jgi:hypothetical protein